MLYQLICSCSKLDEEFQYVDHLQAQKGLMEIQPEPKYQEFSCDSEQEDLKTISKIIFVKEAFKDPHYKSEAVCSKTQRLNHFLPKIIEKYEKEQQQERTKRAKIESIKLGNSKQTSNMLVPDSNTNEQHSSCSISSRSRGIKKEQYPTKNMLPSFKSSFMSYLAAYFPQSVFKEFPIIKRIRQKYGINLRDYEDLFKEEIFKPYLRRYFRNKVIYRDLLQSRIEYKTKRIYFAKLSVFQDAFNTGEFKGIN